MEIQNAVVLVVVAIAAFYLLRVSYKTWTVGGGGCCEKGCGPSKQPDLLQIAPPKQGK